MHVEKQGSTKRYYSPLKLLLLVFLATWQLARAALRCPADIIYIGKPHPMNSAAALIARLFRPKLRLFLDCDDYEAASNRFSGPAQRLIVQFFEDWMPFQVDIVTSNTYFSLDRIRSLGVNKERLVYLPNGVDRERFENHWQNKTEELRAEFHLIEKQVIVYIGSLSLPSHPVDLLLKAFALLQPRFPQAFLFIVGGGEDLQALKNQAQELGLAESVCFTGRVATSLVPAYYRLGMISVDPVYDNPAAAGRAPLKLFESWAAGIPFVTMDVGDRRLLSGDPPAALLAEPGDAESLANQIGEILNNPELREELVERGYERVKNYYWDQILQREELVRIG
jgi:glycosyltransferase involved in cell wall biosynthesis